MDAAQSGVPLVSQGSKFRVHFPQSPMLQLLHHLGHECPSQAELVVNRDQLPNGGKLHGAHVAGPIPAKFPIICEGQVNFWIAHQTFCPTAKPPTVSSSTIAGAVLRADRLFARSPKESIIPEPRPTNIKKYLLIKSVSLTICSPMPATR